MLKPKEVKPSWNSQKEGFQESLHYLKGRMVGDIKSLTPSPS